MSGLVGVGGGFLMVPLQVMLTRTPQLEANANSLAAIVPISIAGVLVYYFAGRGGSQVDFRFALLLVIGGVVGAYVGARLAAHVPEVWLGRVIAVVLAVVGLKEIVSP
jgi:uncharacterized membrane protein YfcA